MPHGIKKGAVCRQFSAAVSAGLAAFVPGAWLAWPSPSIEPLLSGELGFTVQHSEISTLVALMDLGNVLTPIPSSYLMDLIGRKSTLLITAALYILSSYFAINGDNVWMLYIARLLAGMGKGIAFAVVPIFLAEVASVEIRGAVSTMFIGFLNFGMFFDYAIGPFVSYHTLNWLNLIPGILFGLTYLFVPKSPYYLIMVGKKTKARKSLAWYRCVSESESAQGTPFDKEFKMLTQSVKFDMLNRARFVDLVMTRTNRKALLIISMLALFQRLSGISPTLAYSTTMMPQTGGGANTSIYMIIFASILVVFTFLAAPMVDKLGRKFLLMLSSISSGAAMLAACTYYFIGEKTTLDYSGITWVPYACLLAYGIGYSLGLGFVPSTMVAELFPTNVRSYAGSVSAIILAATSFIVNKLFFYVKDSIGVYIMYLLFTIDMIVCCLFVLLVVFETKEKTFTEIQNILHNEQPA